MYLKIELKNILFKCSYILYCHYYYYHYNSNYYDYYHYYDDDFYDYYYYHYDMMKDRGIWTRFFLYDEIKHAHSGCKPRLNVR